MQSYFAEVGARRFHVLEWAGDAAPFVLLHGLSSNARTWEAVAARLAAAGHRVVAVDQRGHGRSDKPEDGYDFATITTDLARLLDALALEAPVVVGQSWGGNVVLEFGARYPGRAAGLGFVDGGFLDLHQMPGATWAAVATRLRPPDIDGTPREAIRQAIRDGHPDWEAWGVEATLANFETLPDGTVRRQLPIPLHMKILRAMWEQRPTQLFPQVQEPVVIAVAEQGPEGPDRRAQVAAALRGLPTAVAYRFPRTDHDIHVHRPAPLSDLLLRHFMSTTEPTITGEIEIWTSMDE